MLRAGHTTPAGCHGQSNVGKIAHKSRGRVDQARMNRVAHDGMPSASDHTARKEGRERFRGMHGARSGHPAGGPRGRRDEGRCSSRLPRARRGTLRAEKFSPPEKPSNGRADMRAPRCPPPYTFSLCPRPTRSPSRRPRSRRRRRPFSGARNAHRRGPRGPGGSRGRRCPLRRCPARGARSGQDLYYPRPQGPRRPPRRGPGSRRRANLPRGGFHGPSRRSPLCAPPAR